MLACDALAPCGNALGYDLHQQDAAARGHAKTRFKRVRERHVHFAHVDCFNLHLVPLLSKLAPSMARRNAARASSRVESSVGNGEFPSFMISGISVHASTTASQPSSRMRPMMR